MPAMWIETQGEAAAEIYANSNVEVPEDLEQWVNEGVESL